MIEAFRNLPDLSFIDGVTLEDIQRDMLDEYDKKHVELTGRSANLQRADPMTLLSYATAVLLYQGYLYIDESAKRGLLPSTYGEWLEYVGALKGVTRLQAEPAQTTVRFTLSAVQKNAMGIPGGTRVSDGNSLYFRTMEYAEIPRGELYTDVLCECETPGAVGSGIAPGQLKNLVDKLAYIAEVANLDTTRGGADVESDEHMKERVFIGPASYSTAGPHDAYVYHTKSFGSSIGDVSVHSPKPVEVEVYFILEDGSLPSKTLCDAVYDHLSSKIVRPLTDKLLVAAPDIVTYDIDITYWIRKSDAASAVSIQHAVNGAIQEYEKWQTCTIGLDINPSELIHRVIAAGAKRVAVRSPSVAAVAPQYVARTRDVSVTYGGIEDD